MATNIFGQILQKQVTSLCTHCHAPRKQKHAQKKQGEWLHVWMNGKSRWKWRTGTNISSSASLNGSIDQWTADCGSCRRQCPRASPHTSSAKLNKHESFSETTKSGMQQLKAENIKTQFLLKTISANIKYYWLCRKLFGRNYVICQWYRDNIWGLH